jgi:hypothetical protein
LEEVEFLILEMQRIFIIGILLVLLVNFKVHGEECQNNGYDLVGHLCSLYQEKLNEANEVSE